MKWTFNKTCCYWTVPFRWLKVDHSATQLDKYWRSSTRTESIPLTRHSALQPHFLPLCSSQSNFKEIFCTRRRWIQLRTLGKRYIVYAQSVRKIESNQILQWNRPPCLTYASTFDSARIICNVLNMQDCRTPSISQTPWIRVIKVTSPLIILLFAFCATHKFIATVTKPRQKSSACAQTPHHVHFGWMAV